MSSNSENYDNTLNPYKTEEFEMFLKMIGEENIGTWTMMAQALGVSKDTITAWKNHPRAREAIRDSLNRVLSEMERSGRTDWKMWHAKAKMLGVSEEIELKHSGEVSTGAKEVAQLLQKLIQDDTETENSDTDGS